MKKDLKHDMNTEAKIRHSQLGMNRIDEAHELENMDRFSKYSKATNREVRAEKAKQRNKSN